MSITLAPVHGHILPGAYKGNSMNNQRITTEPKVRSVHSAKTFLIRKVFARPHTLLFYKNGDCSSWLINSSLVSEDSLDEYE